MDAEAIIAPLDDHVKIALRREKHARIRKMRLLYLFLLIPLVNIIIFQYVPIYGIIIAFKDYSIRRGIVGSPWNNFQHFKDLFAKRRVGANTIGSRGNYDTHHRTDNSRISVSPKTFCKGRIRGIPQGLIRNPL